MKAKITARLLKTLRPKEREYNVKDTELAEFTLRVLPSGVMTYCILYRDGNGRRVRYTIGPTTKWTPAQARDEAKRLRSEVNLGGDPAHDRRAKREHTLGSFLDEEYGPWVTKRWKTGAGQLARVRSAFAAFKDKKLSEINPWLVEKWRAGRLKAKRTPATANRDLAALKSALARAAEWGLLPENPLARLKMAKEDPSAKVRYLEHDEEARLRSALDEREEQLRRDRDSANAWRRDRGYPELPDLRATAFADHLKPMVLLSLNTGLRRGEVFDLEWRDIDLERAMLTVRGAVAKSGKTRHVPLNSEALAVLSGWRDQASGKGHVFQSRDGRRFDNVKKSWQRLLNQAHIGEFRWHDLRHCFASKLVMAGVDLNTVRELLGHSDIKMTLRYAHLAPRKMAEAVARIVAPPGNLVPFQQAAQNGSGTPDGGQ